MGAGAVFLATTPAFRNDAGRCRSAGLITGVADDEPSGIASYSQAGAHQVRRSAGIVRAGWSVLA
jgi:hypothetical protein